MPLRAITKEIYRRRPLLDLPPGTIHILDLLSLPCDGAVSRHRLSDSLLGMLLIAETIGISKNLLNGFETMFSREHRLRGPPLPGAPRRHVFWKNAGFAFLSPDGLPMRFHLSTYTDHRPFSLLLHGKPRVPGESVYTAENVHLAPNALQWIVFTMLAGAPPAGFVYKLGSFNLSNLHLDITEDEIDYESADDHTQHQRGTNPWVVANNLEYRYTPYRDHPIGRGEELTNEEKKERMETAIENSMYLITAWLVEEFPPERGNLIKNDKIMIGGQVYCSMGIQ